MGVSLHALAREVGMRQPSLYVYFDSKDALFDALFADGNRQLLERLESLKLPQRPARRGEALLPDLHRLRARGRGPRRTCCSSVACLGSSPRRSPTRTREKVLDLTVGRLRAAGLEDQGDIDCFVAMIAGLVDAQMSNDPGGTRWTRHLDRLTDLYLDDARRRRTEP